MREAICIHIGQAGNCQFVFFFVVFLGVLAVDLDAYYNVHVYLISCRMLNRLALGTKHGDVEKQIFLFADGGCSFKRIEIRTREAPVVSSGSGSLKIRDPKPFT